jgi:hypothetical protein
MTMTLVDHLQCLSGDTLRSWLGHVGAWDKTRTRKDQFAAAIVEQLTRNLPAIVALRIDAEKALQAELAHTGKPSSARKPGCVLPPPP